MIRQMPVYSGSITQMENQLNQEQAQHLLNQYYEKYGFTSSQLQQGAMGGPMAQQVKSLETMLGNPQEANREMAKQNQNLMTVRNTVDVGMPGSGVQTSGLLQQSPRGTQVGAGVGGQRQSQLPGLFNLNPFS